MLIFIKIAYKNIRSHWRHSLAAMLSIAASIFSITVFQGYIQKVEDLYYVSYKYRGMFGDLIIENKDVFTTAGRADPWLFSMNQEQQKDIDNFLSTQNSNVIAYTKQLNVQGMVSNGQNSTIFLGKGYEVNSAAQMRGPDWGWNVLYGLPLNLSPNQNNLALGKTLGALLNCIPDQELIVSNPDGNYIPQERPFTCAVDNIQLTATTEKGQLNAVDLSVTALMDAGYQDIDSKYVETNLNNAQMLMDTDKISYTTVLLKPEVNIEKFKSEFKAAVSSKWPQIQAIEWQHHPAGELYKKTMSLLSIFRNFVVIVIVTVSILSVFNTMVKVVKERTREIGTLRSIGFSKNSVISIFTIEAFFISLIGCLVGSFFSVSVAVVIKKLAIYYKAGFLSQPIVLKISLNAAMFIEAFIVLTLLTILTSYFVANNTARKNINDNLTYA